MRRWKAAFRVVAGGPISAMYPLSEMQHGGYRERTIQNVVDSDATAVIYFGQLEGGTEQTVLHCIRRQKPYKLIDAEEIPALRAATLIAAFVAANAVATLNVAGPRLSKAPDAHAYAFEVVTHLLRLSRGGYAQQVAQADDPASGGSTA